MSFSLFSIVVFFVLNAFKYRATSPLLQCKAGRLEFNENTNSLCANKSTGTKPRLPDHRFFIMVTVPLNGKGISQRRAVRSFPALGPPEWHHLGLVKHVQLKNRVAMENSGKVLGAIIFGAAVGAAVGLLLAPEKGSEMRKKLVNGIKDLAEDLSEKISKGTDKMMDEVEKMEMDDNTTPEPGM
jgi:hypothetical protein